MWVASVKFNGEKALIGGACKKYNVSALAYPIFVRGHKRSFIVYFTLVLLGEENNKKRLVSFLKKHKRIYGIERHDDLVFGQLREKELAEPVYGPNIFHKEPIRINEQGVEVWTVASFKKRDLVSFVDRLEDLFKAEILNIVQLDVSNLSVLTICPDLTRNQKNAIELAVKRGYYDSPRKIDVMALAKMMGRSYATYHVHLRKAEKKLIPFFFERM